MKFLTNKYSVITDNNPHILCLEKKNTIAQVKNI